MSSREPPRAEATTAPGSAAGDTDEGITLLDLANILLRELRLILVVALAVAAAVTVYAFVRHRDYVATSTFIPQVTGQGESRISGLAAQFGITVAPSQGGETMGFYAELLESRELLQQTALTTYRFQAGRDSLEGRLTELYDIEQSDPAARLAVAVARLDERVGASVDADGGMVRLSTSAAWPGLAEQINRRLLDLVNDFNLRRRQSQAQAERSFVEARLQEARADLEEAEGALEQFLESNRTYENSPQLAFEAARLQRRVDLQQQVYVSLAQAYEQARIEEVRNTPVITIVDRPEGSAGRPGRRLLTNAVVGLFLGLVLGMGLAFARESFQRRQIEQPEAYAEFRKLVSSLGSLRAPRAPTTRTRE